MAASRYDAIVVGARCAGSPTAMMLARPVLRGPSARASAVWQDDLVEEGRR